MAAETVVSAAAAAEEAAGNMRKHPVFRKILLDLVCAGLALIVFALFHHVLPRQQQGLGITVSNLASSEKSTEVSFTPAPETAGIIASTAVNDASFPSTSGSQQSGNRQSSRTNQQTSSGRGSRSGKGGKSSSMNGKGGSALEEDADAAADTNTAAAEASGTSISDKFADKYTDTVIVTENSYSSPDISVTVTEETLGQTTYYLADIYVRDITSFRSALAADRSRKFPVVLFSFQRTDFIFQFQHHAFRSLFANPRQLCQHLQIPALHRQIKIFRPDRSQNSY